MPDDPMIRQIVHSALIKYHFHRCARQLLKKRFVPKQYLDLVISWAEFYKDQCVLEQLWACGLVHE